MAQGVRSPKTATKRVGEAGRPPKPGLETLVILDYGSQYTQFIARLSRELGVFSVILPHNTPAEHIQRHKPLGVVLSGGPNSVYDKGAPSLNPAVLELGVPILGVCYGLQLLAHHFGGKVEPGKVREYGRANISLGAASDILPKAADSSTVWMSHGDHVAEVPAGFTVTAHSGKLIAAAEDPARKLYGLQFHLEVAQSEFGQHMLENFLGLSGFTRGWQPASLIDTEVAAIRKLVGDGNVICGLSGGVDSSVAATLVDRAIGKQQTCIFVDTGLLRKNEFEEVLEMYKGLGLNIKPIRAADRFYAKLKGVTDPEKKRKAIGAEFIAIFEEEARKVKNAKFLVQGTLYPDAITSGMATKASAKIKSHHNSGGLPEKMNLKLIEPLKELFKDEVRVLGKALGLPEKIYTRQPFPGPGLGVRVVGEITEEKIRILQEADAIVNQEIEARPEVRQELYQYLTVLLPVKSVGVMGDGRTYEYACVVKAFNSRDVMTADWARLPYDLLATISSRIVSEVRGINRVMYEITTKPPATIEWE
ncbi:MAG TPA: glutamine-hydrolyzing GMP synthase [Candidatus Saccharimonadales bacterium]|nr:glutamine-hydrolyzing GMP synthase [Candidatus Saccharimonadales bacterium]